MLKKWFRELFGKREMLTPDEAWTRLSPAERQSIIDAACRPLDRAIDKAMVPTPIMATAPANNNHGPESASE